MLTFRKAAAEDIDEIVALVKAAIDDLNAQKIFQWDETYPDRAILWNDLQNGDMFVGMKDGAIASVYALNTESDGQYDGGKWEKPEVPYLVLHRICVHSSFQHMGVGRETLLHIHEQSEKMGYGAVRLDVYPPNPYSMTMYANAGYKKTGEIHLRNKTFDLMEKYL